ncbi:unnamed protein product [Trichobilharzia regenti]|nr:unnamed protein product [Trichobilharzia regenti]
MQTSTTPTNINKENNNGENGIESEEANLEATGDNDESNSFMSNKSNHQMDLITDISQTLHDLHNDFMDTHKSYDKVHSATLERLPSASSSAKLDLESLPPGSSLTLPANSSSNSSSNPRSALKSADRTGPKVNKQ